MLLILICTLIAFSGLYLEFKKEHLVKNKSTQKKYSKFILFIGVIGLISNNIIQYIDSNKLESHIKILKSSNDTLIVKLDGSYFALKELKTKYDSLRVINIFMKDMLVKTKSNLDVLSEKTERGFEQNELYLKNIRTKDITRKRIITDKQKELIISEIKKYNGHKISLYSPSDGDQENENYLRYFEDAFQKSGWIIEKQIIVGGYYSKEGMYEVNVLVNDPDDVSIKEIVLSIDKAFSKIGLNYKFVIDTSLQKNELILYICKGQ